MRVPRSRRALVATVHARLGRVPLLRKLLGVLFVQDLQRFHDVLQTTEVRDHYWVFGGLLLGWARQGALIRHDNRDADFGIRSVDLPKLYAAVPSLVAAGFKPRFRFVNHAGEVTELTFTRRGARFEFFVMRPVGSRLRYFMYGFGADGPVEAEVEADDQPLVHFDFLGRSWLKPQDHERELSSTYGAWRVPDPHWSYLDQPNIVARRPWLNTDHDWSA